MGGRGSRADASRVTRVLGKVFEARDLPLALDPYRIALGAGHLIDICNTIGDGLGTTYKSPKVLLICPPQLSPKIEQGSVFPEMFKGGLEKSPQLSKLYEGIARLGGADFFDANTVITTDGADGLHLTAEAEKKLGTAVATKVKEIMK